MCHQAAGNGLPVQDTQVIRAIRAFKERLGMATGNALVVCHACLPAYSKKRKSFEGKIIQHVVIGALVFLVLAGLPILAGQFSIMGFFFGLAAAALILALCLVDYIPPLNDPERAARYLEEMEQARAAQAQAVVPSGPRPVQSVFSSLWPDKAKKNESAPAGAPHAPGTTNAVSSQGPARTGPKNPSHPKSGPTRKSDKRKR